MATLTEGIWWKVPWWERPRGRELVCVWCGQVTTGNEADEHVIPEALGGRDTLYKGAVCTGCNHRLGTSVDAKIFDEPMFAAGQVASQIPGKKGVRTKIGKHVSSQSSGSVRVQDGESGKPHEFTSSRAIAKCAVNVLVDAVGVQTVRTKVPALVNYVRQPTSRSDIWPFAGVFTPLCTISVTYSVAGEVVEGSLFPCIIFTCASGLFSVFADRSVPNGAEEAHRVLGRYIGRSGGVRGPQLTYVATGSV